ncbi:MAG: GH3 auxin-responsive promoter family protein [Ekhidna sp.]
MAILGTLLKKGIMLRESLEQLYTSPLDLQKQELRNLLINCQFTKVGTEYDFTKILTAFKSEDKDAFYQSFKSVVPIFDYDSMYEKWWWMTKEGQKDVSWPGRIKYFALSSGTSGSPSKYIPITRDMVKSIRKTSMRQILTMSKYDLPASLFSKGILMLGGSTELTKSSHYYEGDLSGITASQIPFWFQHFYKPGKKIAKNKDWNEKLEEIVKSASEWDIGIIAGVPAWLQILIEKIIEHYQVDTIHDIWPNLQIFVHGGVSFEPYKRSFEKLMGRNMLYMETYLASEGFIAFQAFPDRKSMRLVLNNGIFYEFIPFSEQNFDEDGKMMENAPTIKIDEVDEGIDYAVLITTNAGAWRYMIGDVIRFVSKSESEILIAGRTKLFMNLCGEHLSLDNLNKAIELVEEEMDIDVREFTLLGEPDGSLFAHNWYVGTDNLVDEKQLEEKIDFFLKRINDDYRTERTSALKKVKVNVLSPSTFYHWMEEHGKVGSQNKFPRVLKKDKALNWKEFLLNLKKE